MIRQRLGIGDHDENFFECSGILQCHPLAQRADIMAYMKPAAGPVAGQDNLVAQNPSSSRSLLLSIINGYGTNIKLTAEDFAGREYFVVKKEGIAFVGVEYF
jgi:hypothetical protein